MRVHPAIAIAACAAVVSVVSAPVARGALLTWRSTATAGANWSDSANWNPAQTPVSGDSLTFPTPVTGGTRTTNNDLAAGTQINGITVSGSAYTLAGNAIQLGGNFAFTSGTASATGSATLPVTLLQTTDFSVTGVATGTQPRFDWGGTIDGNFGITKSGTGSLRLTTSNTKTYTGDTTVLAGTLELLLNTDNTLPFGAGKGNLVIDLGATVLNGNTNFNINGLNNGANGAGQITRSGTNTKSITLGNGDADGSFSGNITNTGGSSTLNKIGAGTQTLGGLVTVAGTGSVSGGRLNIDGTWSAGLTAATAGTLGGTGSINGLVTINGKLEPGVANGDAVLGTASLLLNAAGTTTLDIDGLARETGYDGVDVTTALTYGGTLNLDFGSLIAGNATFDLFNSGTVTPAGSFAAINLTGAYTGTLANDGSGNWTGTANGQTFTFAQSTGDLTVAVPEPTTALGLIAAGVIARRRRKA